MKSNLFLWILLILTFTSCAQKKEAATETQLLTNKIETNSMDLDKISNQTVKSAIEALQANDKKAWFSFFSDDVIFTDDGRTLSFSSFFDNAFDKKEKFLSIEKVENDGKDIFGNFYAGQWGTFHVYFKFSINQSGKISRLDIGQGK